MKNMVLITFLLFMTMMVGCDYYTNAPENTMILNDFGEKSVSQESITAESSITVTDEITSEEIEEASDNIENKTNSIRRDEYEFSGNVLEDIVFPWTEEDVDEAWAMSSWDIDLYVYSNRCFVDFDNDGISELILTPSYYYGALTIFKKTSNGIVVENQVAACHNPFAFNYFIGVPLLYLDENNTDSFVKKFIIGKDSDNNYYISGYSSDGLGDTCWITKFEVGNGEIMRTPTIYRWGYFKEYYKDSEGNSQTNYNLMYKKYENGDVVETAQDASLSDAMSPKYIEVEKEEIEDFLKQIYSNQLE